MFVLGKAQDDEVHRSELPQYMLASLRTLRCLTMPLDHFRLLKLLIQRILRSTVTVKMAVEMTVEMTVE